MPQYGTHQSWNIPSPAYPTPCYRCRLTDCYSIHGHAASTCTHQSGCKVCIDLAALDQQIAFAQEQLIKLVRKRWVMKSRFNDHHDQLTRRLSMETVSEIFLHLAPATLEGPLLEQLRTRDEYLPPFFLGAVCKRWRHIALGLPRLWSAVLVKPCKHDFSLNSINKWLHRSSTVPLSITCSFDHHKKRSYVDSRLVNLLRSQATRWKHFKFHGPWKVLYDLFHDANLNLQPLNFLGISISDSDHRFDDMESVHLDAPFCPTQLDLWSVPIVKIPFRWSNLRYLTVWYMHVDEMLHVIRHADKLESCIAMTLLEPVTHYPLPASPVVHENIAQLMLHYFGNNHLNVVPYLTLPQLVCLQYRFMPHEKDALVDFLDRSKPPLDTFIYGNMHTLNGATDIWRPATITTYQRLPLITHLTIDFTSFWPSALILKEEAFFNALKGTTGDFILPFLQDLRVFTPLGLAKSSWSIILDISIASGMQDMTWQGPVTGGEDDSEILESISDEQQFVRERRVRPLRSVHVSQVDNLHWRTKAEEGILPILLAIRATGVRLNIVDETEYDLIECTASLNIIRMLPYSGEESWFDLTGNGEPGAP